MTYDVIIRGGTVVDGTGAPATTADVAIRGDRIAGVGRIDGDAARVIDADGLLVTPGFVDIHTHLDAQVAWDPISSSSCWHGVTSVVLGNCGVTFAPCKPADREYLAELMESVEDIPATSIMDGLPWTWETYGEYLRAIDAMPKGLNVGGMVGHCAVRYHAMGDRSIDDAPATDDDIARMTALVDEAIAAGALGFSTSRTLLHKVPDGRNVPGTWATAAELLAIGDVLGARGRGVFEVAPRMEGDDRELTHSRAEVGWMADVSRRSGRPVSFALAQSDRRPDLYAQILAFVDEEVAAGAHLRPQTTARGVGIIFGLGHRTPFDGAPAWQELQRLDLAGRLAALDDDERRARLVDEARERPPHAFFEGVYVLGPGEPSYECSAGTSLADLARAAGEVPVETFIRLTRESAGAIVLTYPFLNQRLDAVEHMLGHPQMVLGLGDSGAHVGQIMDASLPSFFLSYWVRDRGRWTIEEGIRRLTSEPAALFGIGGRGVLQAGAYADVNVLDLDALRLGLPEYVHDFPGGAGRYVQRAAGYACTLVNGVVFMEDGTHSGALAGRVLRSGEG